ncbi:phospholipase A2 family protein [Microvirga arabica]|uniref:Phospholipase A2 family protein n=2 Tax=Microvirga arabica TaxID=1128671 RepID=A0ABV6Y293_9HYPH
MGLILWSANPTAAAPVGAGSPGAPTPLFHGNWCGAGDLNRASPVDALDAACRAHDLCYERVGRGACQCDKALLKATATLVKSPRTPEAVRSKAATVNSLFSAALCTETEKMPRRAGQG